jgi:hypothetical protein
MAIFLFSHRLHPYELWYKRSLSVLQTNQLFFTPQIQKAWTLLKVFKKNYNFLKHAQVTFSSTVVHI